ncbi:MAG: fimbrillin family protein [Bacteroidales bacterium]|nr:fimbrillin family protein [Bacteroidales bacterium]
MKKILFAVAFAALLAVSCNKEQTSSVVGSQGGPVKFTAELKYSFDTRATATAFQNGDEIGIFAGTPIARYNVKGTVGTVSEGSAPVELASPINWQAGQTAATTFAAYFPYLSAKTPEAGASTPMVLPWAVKADQRQLADLDESDLRVAVAANVAVDSPVAFSFTHAFSKINILVNSSAVPGTVEKVEVLGTKREGSVDLTTKAVSVSGDASAIITNHVSASSPFEAIFLPQTAAPQIKVTMDNQTSYTFTMDGSAIAFEAGKIYNTAILIPAGDAQQHSVTFSVGAITDWTNDNTSVTYTGDPTVDAGQFWSVIGTVNGSSWNVDYPMTQTTTGTNPEDGTWEATITVAAGPDNLGNGGDEFKLRWAGDWNSGVVSVGMDPGWWYVDGTGLQGWQANASNIRCKEAGTYKVTLYYPSCLLDVVKQ